MNKKHFLVLLGITVLTSSIGIAFADGEKLESKNTAIIMVDTENNKYTIEKNKESDKGSVKYSANIDTDYFYNICNITSIDIEKLTITSHPSNPGDLHIKAIKNKDGSIHYSTNGLNLKPGESWTTKGNLNGFGTIYTIIGKSSVKGNYTFILKW